MRHHFAAVKLINGRHVLFIYLFIFNIEGELFFCILIKLLLLLYNLKVMIYEFE